ncbi:HlyD family efflux transporter periplasmic adaptor subunit [Massilia sp. S19_KUP03_FR1]|uniref:HlyD family efflux transporter periplasmic adaptor subunit n=1 Tax=Massilia sp. S19_KUP03_FR1 TaxID=3025503 RepID=UPI002FCDC01F
MDKFDQALTVLRPELRLTRVGAGAALSWRLDDPLRQRSFLLADGDADMLALWPLGHREAMLRAWRKNFPDRDGKQFVSQFEQLRDFLREHQLLQARPGDDTRALMAMAQRAGKSSLGGWLRRWMGWQMPLIRPQYFLSGALPLLRMLCSVPLLVLWALSSALGLYLVSRQWDAFLATFQDFSQPVDWLVFAAALMGLKLIHELGHAFAAVHYGALVPTMGLSVAYGIPMLYTDTSDASRLSRRGARVAIGAAGMLAETLVAGPCLLAWAVLPDGPLRAACFAIATSSLLTTLVVNLNPLGRFDGYYILSDLLRYPNLQQRSLQYAAWWLQRILLGPAVPAPGAAHGPALIALVAFGVAVWVFRLGAGLGVAQVAYDYLFQAAGIVLAALTLWWTVLAPIHASLLAWRRGPQHASARRLLALGAMAALSAALLFMPLDHSVDAAATLGWADEQVLLAPEIALVEAVLVRPGAAVKQGQTLLRLRSTELERKRLEATAQQTLNQERVERIAGDASDRSQLLVLEQEQGESMAMLGGIVEREKQLELRALADGVVVDMMPNLTRGRWVRSDQPLGRVLQGGRREVTGYIGDADLLRVQHGARAVFYPDDISVAPLKLQVLAIEAAAAEAITPFALASVHGGPLPSALDRQGRAVPKASLHRVRLSAPAVHGVAGDVRLQRGRLRIEADPESVFTQAGRRLLRIVLRELQG